MNYPGEYPTPLIRTTNVQCPVVAGYVTARLQVQGAPLISASGWTDNLTTVNLHNTGANAASIFLQGTDDYVSGPRENLITVHAGTVAIARDGHTSLTVYPRHTFLEVKGFSGTTTLRMQLSSRLRWDQLGFDKTDAFYPPFLWNNKNPITTSV